LQIERRNCATPVPDSMITIGESSHSHGWAYPIVVDGQEAGAISVGGAMDSFDEQCVKVALAALRLLGEEFSDIVSLAVIRIELKRVVEFFFRHGVIVLFYIRHAEMVVKRGIFRIARDRLLEEANR
jgi:hypothetical protein